MKNIKQTLSEELNKMQFLLGYQRGMVISEQATPSTTPGVTDTALPKPAASPKPSIRGIIEADIAKEKLGLTWAQVKQSFGSTGQGTENQLLYKAWKGGWRPGKEVPAEFQTPTYKQNVAKNPVTTTSTTVAGQIAGSEQANVNPLKDFTPEDLQKKIEDTKQKTKDAKEQNRIDESICKDTADVVDSKGFLGFKKINTPVADQEVCDVLRYCITKGFIKNNRTRNFSACDAFPAKSVTPAPAPAPAPAPSPSQLQNRPTAG